MPFAWSHTVPVFSPNWFDCRTGFTAISRETSELQFSFTIASQHSCLKHPTSHSAHDVDRCSDYFLTGSHSYSQFNLSSSSTSNTAFQVKSSHKPTEPTSQCIAYSPKPTSSKPFPCRPSSPRSLSLIGLFAVTAFRCISCQTPFPRSVDLLPDSCPCSIRPTFSKVLASIRIRPVGTSRSCSRVVLVVVKSLSARVGLVQGALLLCQD